jgi:predicted nucleic acid-binding protein
VRLAFDTNILVYAEGLDGEAMQDRASAAIETALGETVLLPIQVAAELYSVLVRKGRWQPSAARAAVWRWVHIWRTVATDETILAAATGLVAEHHVGFWDAVVLATAAEADCQVLYSEDFQSGFTWRGVTVVNPFTLA